MTLGEYTYMIGVTFNHFKITMVPVDFISGAGQGRGEPNEQNAA